jgi:beta-lactamase superfamily II metal-dependent hydrolase
VTGEDAPKSLLPHPQAGELTIYILGPGFGESQVVVFPDGRVGVVDCCLGKDGLCLPCVVLDHIGKEEIDLLVVTHPDLDHIRGIAKLVAHHPPRRIWRYPFAGNLRDLAACWVRQDPEDQRLIEVSEALEVLDQLQAENVASEVAYGHRHWPEAEAEYQVWCLAPTPADQVRVRRHLGRLVRRSGDDVAVSAETRQFLRGQRRLGDRPNLLSLALAICWGDRRVVLGGDLERGESPRFGWTGVVALLREDGQIQLVSDAEVVKASHHGSANAFCDEAWELHGRGDGRTIAAIAPFVFGASRLPSRAAIQAMRSYAGRLALSSCREEFGWIGEEGWRSCGTASAFAEPCLVVSLPADGGAASLSFSTLGTLCERG